MTTVRRRHLLAGLTWLPLGAQDLRAQNSDMSASADEQQRSEVQVGAGTDAGVTTGSSGSKEKKPKEKEPKDTKPAAPPPRGNTGQPATPGGPR